MTVADRRAASRANAKAANVIPLLSFWKSKREEVLKLTIGQVVSNAGDGNLRDGSDSSNDLRGFLNSAPSHLLFRYAGQCL